MRLLPLLLLPIAGLASASTLALSDRGPGLPGARQGDAVVYAARDFDRLGFGLAASAEVRVGPAWSVRATGPADVIAGLRVAQDRGMLEIGRRYRNQDSDPRERDVRFVITMPRLTELVLGGSGQMQIDQVSGPRLGVSVGGSGDVAIGRLAVDSAAVAIGGSGSVTTSGTARALTVNIGGSGSLDAPRLRAASATVATAGSGSVRAGVDGPARVSTVGSGRVDLGPRARCQISRVGRSEVRCGG